MDLLKRSLAPLLPEAWDLVDAEAMRVLTLHLAGRKVVDFLGPHGLGYAAVNTGRIERLPIARADATIGLRKVQPLIEVRVPITLDLDELDSVARGAGNPDLGPIVKAAEEIAAIEDDAIFNGLPAAGIMGLVQASPHPPQTIPRNLVDLPRSIIAAKDALRASGVSGPYALVLGASIYDQVLATSDEGHPLAKRLEQMLLDRPLVRAAALQGGVLLSLRGGDYELTVGQDLSIGYAHHAKSTVELYLLESFTFRVLEPTAAVRMISA